MFTEFGLMQPSQTMEVEMHSEKINFNKIYFVTKMELYLFLRLSSTNRNQNSNSMAISYLKIVLELPNLNI